MKIRIIDYGVGNLHSALKAFRLFGDASITSDIEEVRSADALVLPGVGAFAAGMEGLRSRNLINTIRQSAKAGTPIMGICLGAQLLMTKGFEFGEYDGLDIIPGRVVHFPETGERIPHIGWNEIVEDRPWNGTHLDGIGNAPEMYFVHSFIMQPSSPDHSLATTTYGSCTFTSVVRSSNTFGCQFHPEKSGAIGLRIIENFVRMCERNTDLS